ncbi:MAG: hypothetical protein ACTSQJ_17250 [Promethearchaeota archaeon]
MVIIPFFLMWLTNNFLSKFEKKIYFKDELGYDMTIDSKDNIIITGYTEEGLLIRIFNEDTGKNYSEEFDFSFKDDFGNCVSVDSDDNI